MMKKYLLTGLLVTAGLFIGGCTASKQNVEVAKPSPKVQSLINKHKLQVVNYEYVKKAIGKGTRNASKVVLIDARPNAKYKKSTIPSSLNIPDTKFDMYFPQIKDIKKDKEIIVYCGGWECAKSPKVASMLIKKGFTNVKLYQAGEPQWKKKNYIEVDVVVVKAAQAKNSALLIDARPYKLFLKETIPGSIAIPDTKMKELMGRFPHSKGEKIIVYCGGYECGKSHKVAKKLKALGYKNVAVFAGGIPAWKKAGLNTTAGAKKAVVEQKEVTKDKFSKNGVKLGSDEGTVDGEWLKALIIANKVPANVQLVDVRSKEEYANGHLKGAINIYAEPMKAKALYAALPKGKTIIFNCSIGGRSLEAWTKLYDEKIDVSEIFYFDANISCKGEKCSIEVNEPLE
jgi:rhodanese-related sulfurtransferase